MSRRDLIPIEQRSFRGGINQEPSGALSNQVLDAQNMFINERGDLTRRPGTLFEYFRRPVAFSPGSLVDSVLIINDTVIQQTGNVTGLNLAPGSQFFFGMSSVPTVSTSFGFEWALTGTLELATTADTVLLRLEYWNGTGWVVIENLPARSYEEPETGIFKTDGLQRFYLAYVPTDWAQSTIQGEERYFLRATVCGNTLFTTGTSVFDGIRFGSFSSVPSVGAQTFEFSSFKRRSLFGYFDGNLYQEIPRDGQGSSNISSTLDALPFREPLTSAVIPEFGRAYVAYANRVFVSTEQDPFFVPAEVETSAQLIGSQDDEQEPDVLYDTDTIAQLTEYPRASYVLYFRGRMWAAGLKDEPFTVRWSGPTLDGAQDIWPEVSFEVLSEDDNSPITALASLNEHPVVFKRDSIWLMVFTGINDLGLATFSPTKVVSGISTVSQASVVNVNGALMFLAEDGFYLFDGTPNVRKLSDVIDDKVRRVVPSRKPFSTAVHWRSQNLYLCATSIDGASENNFVFVYDYKDGGWEFWHNLSVQAWLREESVDDIETILFADNVNRVYKVSPKRRTDAGRPIPVFVLPFRLGYGDAITKRWRQYNIWTNNTLDNVTVDFLRQDESTGTRTIDIEDIQEAQWDNAQWDVSEWVQEKRRQRRLMFRETSEWVQPRLSSSTTQNLEIYSYRVGYKPLGFR